MSLGSFGSDIGAILRSGLAPLQKLMAIAVRYHHPDGAGAKKLAETTGLVRSTTYELLGDVEAAGFAVKDGPRWMPACPQYGQESVRHTDTDVRNTDTFVRHTDTFVRNTDIPPAPPNKEFQTFSRPSPAAAAPADAHTREASAPPSGETGAPVHLDHLGEFVELWLRTQATRQGGLGPGLTGSPAMRDAIAELLRTHDIDRVRWAIQAATEKTRHGAPSLGFLRKLCAEGPLASTPRQGRTPASPYRNPDQSAPCGPRPVDPSKGEIDF